MMIGSQSESSLWMATLVHIGCALKTISYPCEFMDFDDPAAPSLVNERIRMENGRVYPPEGPGLGLTLDEDAVERYTVRG